MLAASKSSGGSSLTLLIFPLLLVAGYMLLIRPQRRRQQSMVEMRNKIEPGVEVVTTAGLIATVVETDDETVTLEIAPGVHSRFLRQAVVRVVVDEPVEPDSEPQPPAEPAPDATDEAPPETAQA